MAMVGYFVQYSSMVNFIHSFNELLNIYYCQALGKQRSTMQSMDHILIVFIMKFERQTEQVITEVLNVRQRCHGNI